MSPPDGNGAADVRLIRPGQVEGGLADTLGAQRLAEVTHLPTGIASDHIEAVQVPAGGSMALPDQQPGLTLLHVIDGTISVRWGDPLDGDLQAGSGDTVLVPAGTACRADNQSPSAVVQLILVRGD